MRLDFLVLPASAPEPCSPSRNPGFQHRFPTIRSARKIAWKTGTRVGLRDGRAIDVTAKCAVGVWAGRAGGEGRPGLAGTGTSAPILLDIFIRKGIPPRSTVDPTGV
jgi:membrane carboxypeptidase/penicillin-binding protein PbpC